MTNSLPIMTTTKKTVITATCNDYIETLKY